ncbi:MAG: helix-turn-helix domain-containing protein [Phascolarctobacterium succinatutens]|uniref:Crp/Fnr family transcriptional regulator n=1 Tax=Phascolarctobacterium succinatutens TaxID=626940 RepID=UPI0023F395B3|nr:helix-turn-helix domain-containing protein [Phascolarctobacterium succinatutens]MDD7140823.1 helix-turn-helix domain-containing protein [Phascolarctobacterium succinatutens]
MVSYFAASDSEILMLPLGRMLFDGSNHNETNRRLMCNIVSILADNNTRLIEKTEILCKKTLRGKIMAYLEQEARYNGSDKFTIPFNRTDLANYLDADRSALTRELARMRADGLISFEKNTFEILEHSHTE